MWLADISPFWATAAMRFDTGRVRDPELHDLEQIMNRIGLIFRYDS